MKLVAIVAAALPPGGELTAPQVPAANAVAVGLMAVDNRIDHRTIDAQVRGACWWW